MPVPSLDVSEFVRWYEKWLVLKNFVLEFVSFVSVRLIILKLLVMQKSSHSCFFVILLSPLTLWVIILRLSGMFVVWWVCDFNGRSWYNTSWYVSRKRWLLRRSMLSGVYMCVSLSLGLSENIVLCVNLWDFKYKRKDLIVWLWFRRGRLW